MTSVFGSRTFGRWNAQLAEQLRDQAKPVFISGSRTPVQIGRDHMEFARLTLLSFAREFSALHFFEVRFISVFLIGHRKVRTDDIFPLFFLSTKYYHNPKLRRIALFRSK